jgi:hypothetical protein
MLIPKVREALGNQDRTSCQPKKQKTRTWPPVGKHRKYLEQRSSPLHSYVQ